MPAAYFSVRETKEGLYWTNKVDTATAGSRSVSAFIVTMVAVAYLADQYAGGTDFRCLIYLPEIQLPYSAVKSPIFIEEFAKTAEDVLGPWSGCVWVSRLVYDPQFPPRVVLFQCLRPLLPQADAGK